MLKLQDAWATAATPGIHSNAQRLSRTSILLILDATNSAVTQSNTTLKSHPRAGSCLRLKSQARGLSLVSLGSLRELCFLFARAKSRKKAASHSAIKQTLHLVFGRNMGLFF